MAVCSRPCHLTLRLVDPPAAVLPEHAQFLLTPHPSPPPHPPPLSPLLPPLPHPENRDAPLAKRPPPTVNMHNELIVIWSLIWFMSVEGIKRNTSNNTINGLFKCKRSILWF